MQKCDLIELLEFLLCCVQMRLYLLELVGTYLWFHVFLDKESLESVDLTAVDAKLLFKFLNACVLEGLLEVSQRGFLVFELELGLLESGFQV